MMLDKVFLQRFRNRDFCIFWCDLGMTVVMSFFFDYSEPYKFWKRELIKPALNSKSMIKASMKTSSKMEEKCENEFRQGFRI